MAKLFPESMSSKPAMTLEGIASKLGYFREQLELLHWQTTSEPEHRAIGGLYEYIDAFKDDVIEKLMGYTGTRPTVYKREPLVATSSMSVVSAVGEFAYALYEWAGESHYCDVENMAQELSGKAAKTKYLLTLS
jgi:5-keto 4-deoxyuronate isomerase